MVFKNNFKREIFHITNHNFNERALELFQFQWRNNRVYKDFVRLLGIETNKIQAVEEIPFLPIAFFKSNKIFTGNDQIQIHFQSSGTSGQQRSKHFVSDPKFYEQVSKSIFESWYGNLSDWIIVALLPSYQENSESSLIHMVNFFMQETTASPYYLKIEDGPLLQGIYENRGDKKVLLIGVTYALLEMAENFTFQMEDAVVMETGGMKGRGQELTRQEVHEILKQSFGVHVIHSEYGMTELFSQAYSQSAGLFKMPYTMKVLAREINDPLSSRLTGYGGLNIIDLANIDSCAFIATEDLGNVNIDKTFQVLGRMDNSESRGCNLLSVGYS